MPVSLKGRTRRRLARHGPKLPWPGRRNWPGDPEAIGSDRVTRTSGPARQAGVYVGWHSMAHASLQLLDRLHHQKLADFESEGAGQVRLEAGTIMHQPAMNRHREGEMLEDFEAVVFHSRR